MKMSAKEIFQFITVNGYHPLSPIAKDKERETMIERLIRDRINTISPRYQVNMNRIFT